MSGKILLVGTCFKDKNSIITQAELLYDELVCRNYNVSIVSKHRGYVKRLYETTLAAIKLKKNDIILLQVYGSKSIYLEFLVSLIGSINGCKIISTLHGGLIPDFYSNNRLKRWLLDRLFKLSDTITVPNSYIKIQLEMQLKNAIVIKNLLPFKQNQETQTNIEKSFVIFWMRAFHEVYNPIKAVHILAHLHKSGLKAKMHMAGPDMGLLEATLQEIKKHQLEEFIVVHPKLSQTEINTLVSSCLVYLCTNDVDNAPVTFTEMMARGIPIVSTCVGGIPHLVENRKHALLSRNNSVEDLAELIIELYNTPELRNRLIKNGKDYSQEFTPDKVVKNWEALLKLYDIRPIDGKINSNLSS